jgi:hypothetical protein
MHSPWRQPCRTTETRRHTTGCHLCLHDAFHCTITSTHKLEVIQKPWCSAMGRGNKPIEEMQGRTFALLLRTATAVMLHVARPFKATSFGTAHRSIAVGCHEVKRNKIKHNSTFASTVTTAAHLPTWAGGVPPNWSCDHDLHYSPELGGASHTPTLPRSHTPTFLNAKSIRSISIMKIPQQMGILHLLHIFFFFFSQYCTQFRQKYFCSCTTNLNPI